jgi:Cu2+-exporting ATPase
MLLLSGGTLLLLGPWSALTVLCSYVGYSLRITGPLSVLNYGQLAARRQILLKDGRALETLHTVDTVIFDKTGTLTQDQPQVVSIYTCADYTEDEVLALAVAAEHHQTHPIAHALLQAADERRLFIPTPSDVRYEPGLGLQIKIDGAMVLVGSARLLEHHGISIPVGTETIRAYCHQRGHSLVYVARGNIVIGTIELAAPLRPSVQQTIYQLQQLGKTVWIVSGDHEQPTRWLARTLHADAYYAGMLPPEKASLIAQLQAEGKTVCFVGDGINDALALKQANVSISLHGATGLAIDTAQIVLPNGDMLQLLTLFDMSSCLHTRMQGNLMCSMVPGIITIGGVYLLHFGIVAAYILYYTGLTAGIANAMLPLALAERSE